MAKAQVEQKAYAQAAAESFTKGRTKGNNAKDQYNIKNGLAKASKASFDGQTVIDARRAMATTTFTPEQLGMKVQKKASTSSNMATVFAGEATMDVARS